MPNCITDSLTCQLVNQCKQWLFTRKNVYILALPTYTTHSILEPILKLKSAYYTPSIYGTYTSSLKK